MKSRRSFFRRVGDIAAALLRFTRKLKQPLVWHPNGRQGTKWITLRETSTGLYPTIYFEIDRNKTGRITLIPAYAWDEQKRKIRSDVGYTTLDKNVSELFTEKQAVEKLSSSPNRHPVVGMMAAKS